MHAALRPHGSDGGGRWQQGTIGLGQALRRLTDEDQHEQQPLTSADGGLVLVWDGRLDNREELFGHLGLAPDSTVPDSRLLLMAWIRWGDGSLRQMVGAFAFALWDGQTGSLLLVRSPIIAPSLFYHSSAARFVFATVPGALFASGLPRRLNERKLADMLVQSPADAEATLYQEVQRLPTGSVLRVTSDGELQTHCYWQPDPKPSIHFASDDDYVAAFNELLERVVAAQLRSAKPVAVLMSGGLDSTAVAAVAAQCLAKQGQRLSAYTAVPAAAAIQGPGWYADETPLVQAVASRYTNLDLHLLDCAGQTFLDGLEHAFATHERYLPNTSNRVWMETIYAQAAQAGVGVILSGMQGNLTFSRNGEALLAQWVRRGQWSSALRHGRHLAGGDIRRSLTALLPGPVWLTLQALRGRTLSSREQAWLSHSPIHPEFAARHQVGPRARAAGQRYGLDQPGTETAAQLQALMLQDVGQFDVGFRARFGIDTRHPAADVRIAEFCLALPDEQFCLHGQPRSLIRRAMRDRLPEAVTQNRRRGMQGADWFFRLSAMRPTLAAELERLTSNALAREVLDLERMRAMLDSWPASEGAPPIDYLLVLERGLAIGCFLLWFSGETGTA